MSLVRDIVTRIDDINSIPERVERCASRHIMDAVGVGFAAAGSDIGEPWRRHGAAVAGADGPASIFGQASGASPADAALVNGGLIHSLEYDDTHTGSIAHGSAVLAATAIASGEAAVKSGGKTTGRAILRSYLLWYEVLIRIGLAAPGGFQRQGFQLTSVGGALCAAGIAADLRGLDHARTVAALGIALSQASGVFEFLSNGATVKSMHPGWAAHSGLIAADLAAAGITGPDTALEGRFGLFRVFAGDAKAAARFATHLEDLGKTWHLEQAAFKFLPCCHYLHSFVEASKLLSERGVSAGRIKEIEFGVPAGAASIICDPWDEKCSTEGHSARWSLPVTVAMQLVDGTIGLDSFERKPSAGVAALARLSRWSVLEDSSFPQRFDALVRCRMRDGAVHEVRVDDVYGNASRPPSMIALDDKFSENMNRMTGQAEADRLRGIICGLQNEADVGNLTDALRAASGGEQK